MSKKPKALRYAEELEEYGEFQTWFDEVAAELRRLVSFNNDLMDEVARLKQAIADEREACADAVRFADNGIEAATLIYARDTP